MDTKNCYIKMPLQFRRTEEVLKAPGEGHYLVELEVCGICRSDLIWAQYRSPQWEKIGHEFGGRIAVRGPGSSMFRDGQRVAVKNATACGICRSCRDAKYYECHSVIVNKSGHDRFFIADERSLVDADSIEPPLLSLVEPLSVAKEVVSRADITTDSKVVVYGLGVIGVLAGWLCRLQGAQTIVGVARSTRWFKTAHMLGFSRCQQIRSQGNMADVQNGLLASTDRWLLLAPPECLVHAVDSIKSGGIIVIAGLNENSGKTMTELNVEKLIFKRLSIRGAFGYPNMFFAEAIKLLHEHGYLLKRCISHVYRLSQIEAAYKDMIDRPEDFLKVILVP